jgi:hypothetical protein
MIKESSNWTKKVPIFARIAKTFATGGVAPLSTQLPMNHKIVVSNTPYPQL